MNLCHLCGLSRALCPHLEWGWASKSLMGVALSYVSKWLLSCAGVHLPQLDATPLTGIRPKLGSWLMHVVTSSNWAYAWGAVKAFLMGFIE